MAALLFRCHLAPVFGARLADTIGRIHFRSVSLRMQEKPGFHKRSRKILRKHYNPLFTGLSDWKEMVSANRILPVYGAFQALADPNKPHNPGCGASRKSEENWKQEARPASDNAGVLLHDRSGIFRKLLRRFSFSENQWSLLSIYAWNRQPFYCMLNRNDHHHSAASSSSFQGRVSQCLVVPCVVVISVFTLVCTGNLNRPRTCRRHEEINPAPKISDKAINIHLNRIDLGVVTVDALYCPQKCSFFLFSK